MKFDLLTELMDHPQAALPREQFVEAVWGKDFYAEAREWACCRCQDA
jgi:DNA-binding response OmpR family regulator